MLDLKTKKELMLDGCVEIPSSVNLLKGDGENEYWTPCNDKSGEFQTNEEGEILYLNIR